MTHEPIAVVAAAASFAGASTMAAFRDLVVSGRRGIRPMIVRPGGLDPRPLLHAAPAPPGHMHGCHHASLDAEPRWVPVPSMADDVAAALDPAVRLALSLGAELADLRARARVEPARAGLFLADIALPTAASMELARAAYGSPLGSEAWNRNPARTFAAEQPGLAGPLLARVLGCGGPSLSLDAACASSLYAVLLACDALCSHEADLMVAGGICFADPIFTAVGFSQLRALSPTGACRPFDRRADGLVVGDGGGLVVLRRLSDALAADEPVLGLILGGALSNDLGGSLLSPDSEGQERAMRSAYERSAVEPWAPPYVECHGTGTPRGDAVETRSLAAVRGAVGEELVLGAVKAQVGHTLTAAGIAGLLRAVVAVDEGILPPQPLAEDWQPGEGVGPRHRLLATAEPWPEGPRLAGVSAFGFGGINAHLVVEAAPGRAATAVRLAPTAKRVTVDDERPAADCPIDVIGVAARVGALLHPLGDERGFGASEGEGEGSMTSLLIPEGRFRIAPAEFETMLPQQILALVLADEAARQAGIAPAERPDPRAGVLVALQLDLDAAAYHLGWLGSESVPGVPALDAPRTLGALAGLAASRIARELRLGGPCFTVSGGALAGIEALDQAASLLRDRRVDTMIVVAVDFRSDPRRRASVEGDPGSTRALTAGAFERHPMGLGASDGGAAVVVRRGGDPGDPRLPSLARLKGLELRRGSADPAPVSADGPPSPSWAAMWSSLRDRTGFGGEPLGDAGGSPRPEAPGLWIADGAGAEQADDAELRAFTRAFHGPRSEPRPTTLGVPSARWGDCGAARGLLSFVFAVHALSKRILPASAPRSAPSDAALAAPVHRLSAAAYWLHDSARGPRRAAVSVADRHGRAAIVVLESTESPDSSVSSAGRGTLASDSASLRPGLPARPATILCLAAHDAPSLKAEASRCLELVRAAPERSLDALASTLHHRAPRSDGPLRKAIVVADRGGLIEGLDAVATGRVPGVEPLRGELAFLFPGSGSHRLGLGQALSRDLPGIFDEIGTETSFQRTQHAPDLAWPLGSDARPETLSAARDRLDGDTQRLIFAQVSFGIAACRALQRFGVRPGHWIGYSLGESAALHASRAWLDRDGMFQAFASSDLYRDQLAGARTVVREAWGLGPDDVVDWTVAVVPKGRTEVEGALRGTARLLIRNAPQESVIGGRRLDVEATARALGTSWVVVPGIGTVHNGTLGPVYADYERVHTWPVAPRAGERIWCPVAARPIPWESAPLARSITDAAQHGFDYPAVIEAAWKAGVRHFIECGPGQSCTRLVGRILAGRPHLACSIDPPTEPGLKGLLSAIARLWEAGREIDLEPFFAATAPEPTAAERWRSRPIGPLIPPAPTPGAVREQDRPTPQLRPGGPPASAPAAARGASTTPLVVVPSRRSAEPVGQAAPVFAAWSRRLSLPASEVVAALGTLDDLVQRTIGLAQAAAAAHRAFLDAARLPGLGLAPTPTASPAIAPVTATPAPVRPTLPAMGQGALVAQGVGQGSQAGAPRWDRAACLCFARGRIGDMLGPEFASVDAFPTRVRLPDEPLMLCDRILAVEGAARSMGPGALWTEHDVLPGAFYLDGERAPVCISVEAGQADLFLSGWLGIDFETRGERVYRLLDATVMFHRDLPRVGETLNYHIRIRRFLRQGSTWMFFFEFDGSIDGLRIITMREGCAGFFSDQQLSDGKGLVPDECVVAPPGPVRLVAGSTALDLPVPKATVDALDEQAVERLLDGDLGAAFGGDFDGVCLPPALTFPGGRMRLLHRIPILDLGGGAAGLGVVEAETDVTPDAWYLVCHFVDDPVMPGTLMFEGASHALRALALRRGFVVHEGAPVEDAHWAPVVDLPSRLRCRGQVTPQTRVLRYRVEVSEWGCGPEPYVVGQAILSVDGRPVVRMGNVSLRLVGVAPSSLARLGEADADGADGRRVRPAVAPAFDEAQVRAYCEGPPSRCFGPRYAMFDGPRRLARLPRDPFAFLDRVRSVEGTPFELRPGSSLVAEYDVPSAAWYFSADRQPRLPFAVVLEAALQPCGFLAAWCGAALRADEDLSFRNLEGSATLHQEIGPRAGRLLGYARLSEVSEAASMILVGFDLRLSGADGTIYYTGTTRFGFFPARALAQQVGIRGAEARLLPPASGGVTVAVERDGSTPEDHSQRAAQAGAALERWGGLDLPTGPLALLDRIEGMDTAGGPLGLGRVSGVRAVDPGDWFFAAHFFQDPVMPGSLGLEACLLAAKVLARTLWPTLQDTHRFEALSVGRPHRWIYRGQVLPTTRELRVDLEVRERTEGDRPEIVFHAFLRADARVIYELIDFGLRLVPRTS